jgi:hypothetical protein
LADFGFARYVEENNMAETLCGSPLYMAPEILKYEKYDERADLWSVGAVAYEMLIGKPPFRAQNHIQLLKLIERGELHFEAASSSISALALDFLKRLLVADPRSRMSFQDFLKHPYAATSEGDIMDDDFQIGPIPIVKRLSMSAASASSSMSTPRASLISNAFMSRRRSTPTITQSGEHGGSSQTKPLLTISSSSSREKWNWEDDLHIQNLPVKAQRVVQRANMLLDVTRDIGTEPSLVLMVQRECFRLLMIGYEIVSDTSATSNKEDTAAVSWLYGRLRELAVDVVDNGADDESCVEEHTADSLVLDRLHELALRMAVEGGFQELLGRHETARLHYERALFVMEQFGGDTIGVGGGPAKMDEQEIRKRLEIVKSKEQ